MIELKPLAVTDDCEATAFLSEQTGLSKSRIKLAMTRGAVWLEREGRQRRLRRAKTTLSPPDKIGIYYDESILSTEPPKPTLLSDLGCCSIWIKPAGLMSGGSRFGDHCTIDRVVGNELDRPTFLVHRLDKFAWGLMVLAHGKKSAAHLSRQFQERTVSKTYQALIRGRLMESRLLDTPIDGKPAISHVRPIRPDEDRTLVEVRIETGRKHQIRKHLAESGHPIVGDRLYGSEDVSGLQLAAVELGFLHPETGEPLTFNLPAEYRF
ncbi:MAG: RNA pseudouridine synthase [Gammaproteobacteria bacterium]|nr:RNA pseudouridine synthase [Gammaproteobacteria bacterium]MBT7372053.1 RNA pseudouridine synthase [Gammaproteobacteria bacterium]